MATLKPGGPAPEFKLADLAGKQHSLAELRGKGPVLVAFFKVGCPTCQYTFPFLQRLRELAPESKLAMVGISQDDRKKTAAFNAEFGVRFPVLVDPSDSYAASNAYGLTHVPSLFLVEPDGRIALTSVGFAKVDLEELARRYASAELFHPDEQIQAFRAG
jgi:peroxiredoxin